jgi:O-succinylbenzoate synthase
MGAVQVALGGVELRLVRLPLAQPFRAAHATRTERTIVVVRVVTRDGPDGWGECVAEPTPTYWPEYTAGCWGVLRDHLVPRLLAGRPLAEVRGHHMSKAALEVAVADAALRAERRSLASFLGATRAVVPTGIALGMADTVGDLVAQAERWHDDGHRAFKLKAQPGWDVEPVRAVRKALGDDVSLVADANGAYRSGDPDHDVALHLLAGDDLALAAIEQPYAPDDLVGHARLAAAVPVPVCLDESIGSLGDLETALALGACGAVCLKVGRVGGLTEALRIHSRCRADGVGLRGGGMLETGLGRALNLAVAALPGCTLPPDLGPSRRYFADDLTVPFESDGGTMAVPDGPGLGVSPLPEALAAATVDRLLLRAEEP